MIINIVLTTICHSLCAAVSIIFFIAALMSGWDTGETMKVIQQASGRISGKRYYDGPLP